MERLSFLATCVVGVAMTASCATSEHRERVAYTDLSFSIWELDGWTVERQPGAVIFVADTDLYGDRVTITVQSSTRLDPDVPNADTPKVVFQATETVLDRMPDSDVSEPRLATRGNMPAAYFDAVFRPRNKDSLYERRHVVLVGKTKVFHVLHTGPRGSLAPSAEVFEQTVRSITEES